MINRSADALTDLCRAAHTSRRFFAGAAVAAAAATALVAAWVYLGLGGPSVGNAVGTYGALVAGLVALAGCGVSACLSQGRNRLAWTLLGLGVASWVIGDATWISHRTDLRPAPGPSPADVGFLGIIPFGIAGLLFFAAPARRSLERSRALVDGLLIAACCLFVSWEFVLGPIYRASAMSPLARSVILAHPVGDVAMLSIAALALTRVREESRWAVALLLAGILGLVVSDSAFAYLSAHNSYRETVFEAGWVAGFLLIFLASLRVRDESLHGADDEAAVGRGRMLVPNLAFLAALGSGAWVLVSGRSLGSIGLSIALAVAAFTLASNLLIQLEHRALLQRSRANERALVESRRALLQVVESAPVILFSISSAGMLTLVTGAGLAGFAARATELEGRDIREVLKDAPEFLATVTEALAGVPGQVLAKFESGDLDVRLLPVVEDGRVVSVSGVAVDVTERRRTELARRESEAKSRFLATMTHELRTPLNSILGFTELLLGERRGPLNDQQRRYVTNVLSSGRHLLALITDLLDLSRVAGGEVEVNLQRVSLPEAINEAAAKIRPMADRKHLELTVDGGGPPEVLADPLRLQQVLLNLLSNAVKFTADGGAVGIGSQAGDAGVAVSVRDTGVGIRPEHLELIFDEYSQLDGPGGSVREGIGLGLAVSRRLAVLMGGGLDAESVAGQGSTFHLRLPAPAVVGPQPVEAEGISAESR